MSRERYKKRAKAAKIPRAATPPIMPPGAAPDRPPSFATGGDAGGSGGWERERTISSTRVSTLGGSSTLTPGSERSELAATAVATDGWIAVRAADCAEALAVTMVARSRPNLPRR